MSGILQGLLASLVAAGGYKLYAWGKNNRGQLGLSDSTSRSSPVQVGGLTDWEYIGAGGDNSFSIKTDSTLWIWGYNGFGQLGQNDRTNRNSPVQLGALSDWYQPPQTGAYSISFVKENGTLWSWGRNANGAVGDNTTVNRSSPVQIGALTTWSMVDGVSAKLAIRTNNTLWSWGRNNYGQLGLNDIANRSSPVQVGALTNWSQVATSYFAGVAIKTNGTLWGWGRADMAATAGIRRSSPVQIGSLTNWAQISVGVEFTMSIKTDGTLWAWGDNTSGQLGQNNRTDTTSPVQVGVLTNWSNVGTGNRVFGAVKTDGTLWTCGENNDGQLGIGIGGSFGSQDRSSPVQVGSLTNWVKASGGSAHIIALSK